MEHYLELLKQGGADLALCIDPATIQTATWTVYRCQFGCNSYGQNHCCPPSTPTWRQTQDMINCYRTAILFRCHTMSVVTPLAVQTARELFLDGYYKVIAFGSSPCEKCTRCNPERCNFPGKAVPSMDACGIDVFATVRNNDLEIHTLREKGELQNHFVLLLVE